MRKQFFKDLWELKSVKIFLVSFAIGLIASIIVYYFPDSGFWEAVLAGFLVGMFFMFLQICIDYENLRLNKIIKKSALKDILRNRSDKKYYENLLTTANKEVSIMGVTVHRFFQDFGSLEESEKRIIDILLDKKVEFKILLTDKDSKKGQNAKSYIEKYEKDENFEVRYFDINEHIPQSIFVVDDQCILGPIFTDQDSKDTVAIHIDNKNSIYAKQYMKYFDKVWEASAPKCNQ